MIPNDEREWPSINQYEWWWLSDNIDVVRGTVRIDSKVNARNAKVCSVFILDNLIGNLLTPIRSLTGLDTRHVSGVDLSSLHLEEIIDLGLYG